MSFGREGARTRTGWCDFRLRIVWLIAWVVLHNRWKARAIAPGRVGAVTQILIALGVLGTFQPFWGLL